MGYWLERGISLYFNPITKTWLVRSLLVGPRQLPQHWWVATNDD